MASVDLAATNGAPGAQRGGARDAGLVRAVERRLDLAGNVELWIALLLTSVLAAFSAVLAMRGGSAPKGSTLGFFVADVGAMLVTRWYPKRVQRALGPRRPDSHGRPTPMRQASTWPMRCAVGRSRRRILARVHCIWRASVIVGQQGVTREFREARS